MKYLYETAFCYDDVIRQKSSEEVLHQILSPLEGKLDIQIPEGVWVYINVIASSVIFEVKDGYIMNRGMLLIKRN